MSFEETATSCIDRCSVIVVIHNSGEALEVMLDSLPQDAELVVVDNASSDNGAQIVRRKRPDAKVIRVQENCGFGAGCNIGARAASGTVLVFLNPDALLDPAALSVLVARLHRLPDAIVGPAIFDQAGNLRYICRRRSIPLHEIGELIPLVGRRLPSRLKRDLPRDADVYRKGGPVDYLQGACLAIRRELFERIGGFDEDFFLYSEEEDLCERVRAEGGLCVYEPAAIVRHAWGTSAAKVPEVALRAKYRSRIILYRKRYGTVRGAAVAFGIATGVAVHAVFWPLVHVFRPQALREPRWCATVLRGIFEGTRMHLRQGPQRPPAISRPSNHAEPT